MNAVYIYYTPDWQPLADIVLPILKQYCAKYKYRLHVHYGTETERVPGYYKMEFLPLLLEEYNLIWVLDLDTLITSNIPFTHFTDNEHDIFITEDVHGINAGSWIVRNTEASRRFIEAILNDFDAPEEQTVMKRYIGTVTVRTLPHPSINSYIYSVYVNDWDDKVGADIEMPTHEQGNWKRGDLLLHLPGLTIEQRIEIFKTLI